MNATFLARGLGLGALLLQSLAASSGWAATEQAVGSYAAGRLVNADRLPESGTGFVKLFVPRDRGWLTRELSDVVQGVASRLHQRFPEGERLQLGDSSGREGGPISGHASHQNGLDIDIAFLRANHTEQDPQLTTGFQEVFVRNGTLSRNFDLRRNWFLVRAFYATGRINRMFVDPAIKRAFCRAAGSSPDAWTTEVLRRLRPLAEHDDHVHVRLLCPEASPRCVPQEAPEPGSGCDAVSLRRSG